MRLAAALMRRPTLGLTLLLAALAAGAACLWWLSHVANPPVTRFEQIQKTGVLKVASVYGRTTCYSGPTGLVGYECELVQGIAASIGATAEVLFVPTPADAVQAVLDGRADIAAAALSSNLAQHDLLRFSSAVDRSAPQLVFRMGNPRPRAPADLNGRLLVSEGAGHGSRIAMLSAAAPGLKTETTNAFDAEDLLFQVARGELEYTIASSALVTINERYYPRILTAFDVGEPEDVVLAFKKEADVGLYLASEAYLASISGKQLARLHDRYYGHMDELDYFSTVQVANHMLSRLPRYREFFQASGDRHGIDWRLLAAIGYQESHWSPSATSYTGVRGIMMLTGDTAARYKISNREDPAQSIEGGARVLADLLTQVPADVQEPDRTWMALAAYNQGLGHLLDALALTTQRGGDALHWVDVRDTYPLLSRPRWVQKVKYGFARGREAVDFVANVRSYLDIITMLSSGVRTLPPPPLKLDSQLRTASATEAPIALVEPTAGLISHPQLETDETLSKVEATASPTPGAGVGSGLKLDTLQMAPRESSALSGKGAAEGQTTQ